MWPLYLLQKVRLYVTAPSWHEILVLLIWLYAGTPAVYSDTVMLPEYLR